jgi:hypothetical protein
MQCPRQEFCLNRNEKGSTPLETNLPGDLQAETLPCGERICSRGGVVQISPVIGDLAA